MGEHEGGRLLDALEQRRVINLRGRFRGSDEQQSHDTGPDTTHHDFRG
jgi:hypothetical protein